MQFERVCRQAVRVAATALVASWVLVQPARADPACFDAAADRYRLPASLLRAVARVESGGLNARTAQNTNRDGTRDIGRMQINTGWLPTLSRWGIDEEKLRDECVSIHVGAWILAGNVARHGANWEAVGAYNVGCRALAADECTRRRNAYAWRVWRAASVPPKSGGPKPLPSDSSVPTPTATVPGAVAVVATAARKQLASLSFDDAAPETSDVE
jgi:soluble lytic murein transglycosylase-like protein